MTSLQLNPTEDVIRHLLEATFEHVDAYKALDNLSDEDAFAQVGSYPHSIAQLVAHMHFWQQRRLAFALGREPGIDAEYEPGVTDFPAVTRESWPQLRDDFLASFEELIATAADEAAMQRVVLDNRTVGFMLASHACHNSYHVGQIVMLRIELGSWQPEH